MISRWLCVGMVGLAALLPVGCAHKRCCSSSSSVSAYPCCPPQPCCNGGPAPMPPVAPVATQAFSAPVGAPGCCNGR